jgi:transcriptional regulator with XRE-family HTH domain
MSELTPFGLALRKLRLDKKLRLLDLAQELDLSPAFLSAVETGRKAIPDGFVTKLSRAMELSAQEVAILAKAKDRTRKEIKVDQLKEEDRELIGAFARQVDKMTPAKRAALKKLLMSSMEGEHPFERKRRGIRVPPLSTRVIRGYAEKVRDAFVPPEQADFPIIWVLEFGILQVLPSFVFDVQEVEEMGDDEGRVPVGGNELILRRDVYEGACKGIGRDRFTACHELGHYLMHRKIRLARVRSDDDKIYCDAEWQADTFAGTLLMSPRQAPSFLGPDEMADACLVSPRAAKYMWMKYSEEGVLRDAS